MNENTSTKRVSALPLGSCPDANICAADVVPDVRGGRGAGVAAAVRAAGVCVLTTPGVLGGLEGQVSWGQRRTAMAVPLATIKAMAAQKSKRRVKSERL